jgi:hypothetical protein
MPNTGKLLEGFVERIERLLLPYDFTALPNEKVYNDDGIQIAEFDIEISGKVGTTNFKWLIECRDRPTQGAAPGSWIEQLVGRRERFNFDKVIAVSTTGFTEGASEFAKDKGIEIRTVTEASIEQVSDWFLINEMMLFKRGGILEKATLIIDEQESDKKKEALRRILNDVMLDPKILVSTQNRQRITVATAFMNAAHTVDGFYDDINPNGGTKKVSLRVYYPEENSHFVVESEIGNIRIKEILFQGELTLTVEKIPLLTIRKYESINSGEVIATTASFNLEVEGITRELSFNKIAETGEIRVIVSTPKKPA